MKKLLLITMLFAANTYAEPERFSLCGSGAGSGIEVFGKITKNTLKDIFTNSKPKDEEVL